MFVRNAKVSPRTVSLRSQQQVLLKISKLMLFLFMLAEEFVATKVFIAILKNEQEELFLTEYQTD